MAARENFPNPPLRLVSFELRFPVRRRVATRPVWDAFEEALATELPIVELLVREEDERQLPVDRHEPVLRRTTVNRDSVVTLRYGGLTVETTAYDSYEKLRSCINAAIEALESLATVPSVTRLGLRYINEIRVSGVGLTIDSWRPYVNPALLASTDSGSPAGLSTSWLQGGLGFHSTDGPEHTYVQYAPLGSSSVEPDGVLQLQGLSGPCFLLDIDSFLVDSTKEPVAATRKEVLSAVDRLHDSVEAVFEWSITESLREEVLRVTPVPTADEAPAPGAIDD